MKKMTLGLIASIMLLPVSSFAQTAPQAPAAWVAFEKQERAKQTAFFQELKADREAFLRANPEVKVYFQQLQASIKAHITAMRAARQHNTFPN